MKSPYFSFQKTSKFPYKRTTSGLSVQYFVASDFYEKYGKDLKSVDYEVEQEYVELLRDNCREEQHKLQNLKVYYSMSWSSREKEQ